MKIIGIDPGTATTGFGVIESKKGEIEALNFGIISTKAKIPLEDRLQTIYQELLEIIKKEKPDCLAVEELFFAANSKTALSVGQARGVVLLAAKNCGLSVFEYTPLEVKQAIVGYGRAEKKQMQKMVKTLLNLPQIPHPDDAADALAVAICHAHSAKLSFKISKS